MNRLKALAITSCLGLLAVAFLPASKADEWDKKTFLTVNEPLAVPGKVLQPGKYVMKLLDSQSNRHIVQIYNEDESQLQITVLAIPNYRLEPTGKTQFGFWEMPAGQPRALKAWFYPGDNFGQEFAYPKDLAATIASTNNQPVPTVNTDNSGNYANAEVGMMQPNGQTSQMQTSEQPSAQGNTAQSATPSTTEQSTNQSSAAVQSSTTAAPATDNNTTSAQAANPTTTSGSMSDSSASTSSDAGAANASLPRTASPFPLVGLAGLFSFGAAIAVRAISKIA